MSTSRKSAARFMKVYETEAWNTHKLSNGAVWKIWSLKLNLKFPENKTKEKQTDRVHQLDQCPTRHVITLYLLSAPASVVLSVRCLCVWRLCSTPAYLRAVGDRQTTDSHQNSFDWPGGGAGTPTDSREDRKIRERDGGWGGGMLFSVTLCFYR